MGLPMRAVSDEMHCGRVAPMIRVDHIEAKEPHRERRGEGLAPGASRRKIRADRREGGEGAPAGPFGVPFIRGGDSNESIHAPDGGF